MSNQTYDLFNKKSKTEFSM